MTNTSVLSAHTSTSRRCCTMPATSHPGASMAIGRRATLHQPLRLGAEAVQEIPPGRSGSGDRISEARTSVDAGEPFGELDVRAPRILDERDRDAERFHLAIGHCQRN